MIKVVFFKNSLIFFIVNFILSFDTYLLYNPLKGEDFLEES